MKTFLLALKTDVSNDRIVFVYPGWASLRLTVSSAGPRQERMENNIHVNDENKEKYNIFFNCIPIIDPKTLFSWDKRRVIKLNVFLFVFYGNLTFCFSHVHRGINVTLPELFQRFILYFILQIKTFPCRPVCTIFSSEHKKKKTQTKVKITFLKNVCNKNALSL